MNVDLVRVTTSDGLRLDGALRLSAAASEERPLGVDACLLIHGTGSNFYGSSLLEMAASRLVELGSAALVVNTRGHDVLSIAATAEGPRRQGAARESVDDCRLDLAAWMKCLMELGHKRIALVGHSLGAIKAIYTQALEPHAAVARLIAISPARLSCEYFLASNRKEDFQRTLAAAEEHVREGRPETLMDVTFPLPYTVTAAGYIDKYGRQERYNVLKHFGRLGCPTLVTFGSLEVQSNVAFAGLPDDIESSVAAGQDLTVATIAGADHAYSGARTELFARMERWLRERL